MQIAIGSHILFRSGVNTAVSTFFVPYGKAVPKKGGMTYYYGTTVRST